MDDTRRPDPDALVRAAAAEGRGRLKVFLGSAPGVGKTWEMLAAARHRRAEGVDVLIGIVETHGRAETESQVGDIPILPRRAIPYRGQALEEFDLDAALARRPGLLLIDELAHTNAPGSRHAKRWEDVAEIIAAGIDVWATLNVQHLESLNDDVARITGVRVTETLPDRALGMADEIELIDLPPAELRARLTEGKIYRAETARRALDGFFREGNLAALREIALRRAAEHVDVGVRDYMNRHAIAGPWPAGATVMALVGMDSGAETVVRAGKRLADALHAPWIALHVERLGTTLEARAPLALAAQLGAEIETRVGADLVRVAIDTARRRNVTHLVMGRARAAWWRRVTGRTLGSEMLRSAPDFSLFVVPAPTAQGAAPRRVRVPEGWSAWAGTVLLIAGVTGAGELAGQRVPQEALGMVYLAAVVAAATAWGLRPALLAAALGFLAWDFFFIPPLYAVTIGSARDAIALAVFIVVAVLTGGMAGRVRAAAQAGQARIEGLRRIGGFSRRLGEPTTEPDLLEEIARQAAAIAGRAVLLTGTGEDLYIRASAPPTDTMDEGAWAAARWAFSRAEVAGRGTSTLPSASWRFQPMRTVRGLLGVLGVRSVQDGASFDGPTLQTLEALADQAAVALERVRLANESARTTAQAETQKLRTALLSSLGHDLRTPLAGIRGAAGTLRGAWDKLPAAQRDDLLASIDEDVGRMTRFLANITDLTRLESGQIAPRLAPVEVGDVIDAAIARVPELSDLEAGHVKIVLPTPSPRVLADPMLLEQCFVNVLDNAGKYAPSGSLITVSVTAGGGEVCVAVADQGIGISAEDLPHVFDSFYRARRGDRVAPGTGLGLAIARGLIDAMGGTVEAVSPRPDAPADGAPGTVITVRMPSA